MSNTVAQSSRAHISRVWNCPETFGETEHEQFVSLWLYLLLVQPRKKICKFSGLWVCTGIHLIPREVFGSVLLATSSGNLCLSNHKDAIRALCLLWLVRRQQTHDVKSQAASHTQMVSHVFQWHNRFGKSGPLLSSTPGRTCQLTYRQMSASSVFLVGWTSINITEAVSCFRGKFAPPSVCEGK